MNFRTLDSLHRCLILGRMCPCSVSRLPVLIRRDYWGITAEKVYDIAHFYAMYRFAEYSVGGVYTFTMCVFACQVYFLGDSYRRIELVSPFAYKSRPIFKNIFANFGGACLYPMVFTYCLKLRKLLLFI